VVEADAIIKNNYGIHCRPSALIVSKLQPFDAEIMVSVLGKHPEQVSAKNVLSLIGLGALYQDTVHITVSGENEEEILPKVVELFETNFDFSKDN